MFNGILYSKSFTGEIKPVVIDKDTVSSYTNILEISIVSWRDIVLKHLPANADISSVECELKLEYLHFDYLIPSRVVVPSSALPVYERRESDLSKQTKTIEFKNKFNFNNDYAFEFRLIKHYDENYTLGSTVYENNIPYNHQLGYPIADYIYNNRLPGFIDLMPYLIKNSTLIFGDVKQELRLQINPQPTGNDLIIVGGGYSGNIIYNIKSIDIVVTYTNILNITNSEPVQVLPLNNKRYGFYFTNNSDFDVYYSFGSYPGSASKLILKPSETLTFEDKKLFLNNQEINPGDTRYQFGLPLYAIGTTFSGQQVSIEELGYT